MKTIGTWIASAALVYGGLIFPLNLPAQDAPPSAGSIDESLPQPITEGHFQQVLTHSPFLRTLSLSATYALRGVAEIDGRPVATLYNRDSKKTIYVTAEEANDEGMTLVEVIPAQNLTGVSAKIAVGGEEVELKFESTRIAPQPKGGGRGSSSGGGDRGKEGERRGPSKEDMDRYKALSDAQKEKFRNYIRATMQKYPNMSREERGNMIRGAMTKLSEGRDIEIPQVPQSQQGGGDRGGGGPRPGGDRR